MARSLCYQNTILLKFCSIFHIHQWFANIRRMAEVLLKLLAYSTLKIYLPRIGIHFRMAGGSAQHSELFYLKLFVLKITKIYLLWPEALCKLLNTSCVLLKSTQEETQASTKLGRAHPREEPRRDESEDWEVLWFAEVTPTRTYAEKMASKSYAGSVSRDDQSNDRPISHSGDPIERNPSRFCRLSLYGESSRTPGIAPRQ